MQNIIELKRGAASWLAIHLGPHERETIRLFGQNAPCQRPLALLRRLAQSWSVSNRSTPIAPSA